MSQTTAQVLSITDVKITAVEDEDEAALHALCVIAAEKHPVFDWSTIFLGFTDPAVDDAHQASRAINRCMALPLVALVLLIFGILRAWRFVSGSTTLDTISYSTGGWAPSQTLLWRSPVCHAPYTAGAMVSCPTGTASNTWHISQVSI